jgi:hypothetical protein
MIWDGREQGASATTTWDRRCVDNKRLAETRATCGRNKMRGRGSESEGLECTARTHPHVASDVVATTCIHHSQGALYGSRVTWERHSDAIGAITKQSSPFSAPNSRMGGLLQMLVSMDSGETYAKSQTIECCQWTQGRQVQGSQTIKQKIPLKNNKTINCKPDHRKPSISHYSAHEVWSICS